MIRRLVPLLVALLLAAGILLAFVWSGAAACERTNREDYNPTGWEGCTVYGSGIASRYDGPGVARNDCIWPWTSCQPISITSHQTGLTIIVQPRMFCDCWTRTPRQRLVDLNRAAVSALGLEWADGLYPVTVRPAGGLPDTAMR